MKIKFILMTAISAFAMAFAGCSASVTTSNANAAAPKPADTAANKPAKAETAKGEGKEVKGSSKPEGTSKTAKKDVPVPADWIYFYDDVKGYGFSIPAGTTTDTVDESGIEVTAMTTPSGVDIYTLAYKDKTRTKEDLLGDAIAFLEGLGQKVTPGALRAESDYYAVADATSILEDGTKARLRILVGTDVTDNYVMILGTGADKFAPNEKIIDEIWGSFEMWSDG
jgi:hypothetical protein